MTVNKFIINTQEATLTISFTDGQLACLPFEFLRVFTPSIKPNAKSHPLVTHKKLVTLLKIEHVAQHGFRLLFDDQHSAIYSSEYLCQLSQEYEPRWQHYLTELKASGHSREAKIDITQL